MIKKIVLDPVQNACCKINSLNNEDKNYIFRYGRTLLNFLNDPYLTNHKNQRAHKTNSSPIEHGQIGPE